MSAPAFDFRALLPEPDGRDAGLLADLRQYAELRDQGEHARRRGRTAYNRHLREQARASLDLADRIAATPARTAAGRHAKAMAALRDAEPDPDLPSGGFTGFGALAASALFDIMQAGEEL